MLSVHRGHIFDRDDMSSRHDCSEANINKYADSKGDLEEQYKFFQEMRGYVTDLVECLNEKVGVQLSKYTKLKRTMVQTDSHSFIEI